MGRFLSIFIVFPVFTYIGVFAIFVSLWRICLEVTVFAGRVIINSYRLRSILYILYGSYIHIIWNTVIL